MNKSARNLYVLSITIFMIIIAEFSNLKANAIYKSNDHKFEVVFSSTDNGCEEWDIPDAPARAFRLVDGSVRLIAAFRRNRFMHGPNLGSLQRDCRLSFEGKNENNPELMSDKSWIMSTYTEDGVKIHAILHNEFHGDKRPWLCSGNYMQCWRNSLTYVDSIDGGITFRHKGLRSSYVAMPPYTVEFREKRHLGYFAPTNIIKHNGYYYMLFEAQPFKEQRYGQCLVRTHDLSDAAAWRGWDGRDFSVKFINPFLQNTSDPKLHVCEPVGIGRLYVTVGSIAKHDATGMFVAVYMAKKNDIHGNLVEGVFLSRSTDLINWTDGNLIFETVIKKLVNGCNIEEFGYPSLIDDDIYSRNFELIGKRPWLYIIRHKMNQCKSSSNRELLRVRLSLE